MNSTETCPEAAGMSGLAGSGDGGGGFCSWLWEDGGVCWVRTEGPGESGLLGSTLTSAPNM